MAEVIAAGEFHRDEKNERHCHTCIECSASRETLCHLAQSFGERQVPAQKQQQYRNARKGHCCSHQYPYE